MNLLDTVSARAEYRLSAAPARPRLRDANVSCSGFGSDMLKRCTCPAAGAHTMSTLSWNSITANSSLSAHDHPETETPCFRPANESHRWRCFYWSIFVFWYYFFLKVKIKSTVEIARENVQSRKNKFKTVVKRPMSEILFRPGYWITLLGIWPRVFYSSCAIATGVDRFFHDGFEFYITHVLDRRTIEQNEVYRLFSLCT